MRPFSAQLGLLVVVFAMAKTTIWRLSFLGAAGASGPLIRDLPLLLLSEFAGAAVVILAVAQLLSPSRGVLFGSVVGASQVLLAGLIELGRLSRLDFDWLLLSWALGVETVRPGWIVAHSAADLANSGSWQVLGLAILTLASPFLSSAVMVLVALRPTSTVAKPS